MKKTWQLFALLLTLFSGVASHGEEVRTIKLNEDRDQKPKGSKIYELKHVRCDDITPFILGAVKRYNPQGDVQRLNYKPDGKQFIVVSTGVEMMPYIDAMVEKLDRPCSKKDANGSIIQDDGIYRFTYYPEYRASQGMNEVIQDLRSDGTMYFDAATNLFYWKDSKSDGQTLMTWLKAIDRPVPQAELTINVYDINENDFMELGVDYVAWKNGPGATLFGTGYSYMNLSSGDDVSNMSNLLNLASKASTNASGFMLAPQFDATFLRMLAQKGNARVATSSTIRLVNDYRTIDPGVDNFSKAKHKLRFTPNFQNIAKDSNMNISVDQSSMDFYFYLRKPMISFPDDVMTDPQKPEVKEAAINSKAAQLSFGWVLRVEDMVEQTTTNGQPVINQQNFDSWITLKTDSEKLIASFAKDHDVNQNNSVPFFGDIPGLKYLFGTSVESKTKSRVFVTVKASGVNLKTDIPEWAGKIIETAKLAENKDALKKNETAK